MMGASCRSRDKIATKQDLVIYVITSNISILAEICTIQLDRKT